MAWPRTDVMGFCNYQPDAEPFRLLQRQEYSRTAGGVTIGKDLGPTLWMGDFTTVRMLHNQAREFESILNSLDGVIGTFEACDLRKPMPAEYPSGNFNDTGQINSVSGNSVSLKGLDADMIITRGDYLAFNYGSSRALHEISETVISDASGVTPVFEVRPHIQPGATINTAVKLKNPMAVFRLLPNSISLRMDGGLYTVVSFKGIQAL